MSNFKYKNSGGSWVDVPDLAHPDDESGSVRVVYPVALDRDGNGAPCGIVGLPELVVTADYMLGTGWNFWQAFFASATAETASVSLQVYDERSGAWVKYAATLLRPRCERIRPGATAGATEHHSVEIHAIMATVTT